MPSYPIKNLKTGETQELTMSMKEYDQWRKDNPDWDKDWSNVGRMTVRYRKDFLRGMHGHPDHKGYGKPAKMTVTEENWDPNTPNEVLSNEVIRYKDGGHTNDTGSH